MLAWCRIEAEQAGALRAVARSLLGATRPAALGGLACLALLGVRHGMHPDGALPIYPATTILAFNLVWVGLVVLVLDHADERGTALLRLRPLRSLGLMSYGLYLYHLPILRLFLGTARAHGFLGKGYEIKALSIVAAVAVAALSWRYLERPILALKRRHAYDGGESGGTARPLSPTVKGPRPSAEVTS
jgi:peptidoglycan/LPS O-acetylase OafA/YrhL